MDVEADRIYLFSAGCMHWTGKAVPADAAAPGNSRPLGAGTLTHQDVYKAELEEDGDGAVSWQVDEQGYQYYGENQKASLVWTDNVGNQQTDVLKIVEIICSSR